MTATLSRKTTDITNRKLIDDLNKKIWQRRRELEITISCPFQDSKSKLINPAADLSDKLREYMEWRV